MWWKRKSRSEQGFMLAEAVTALFLVSLYISLLLVTYLSLAGQIRLSEDRLNQAERAYQDLQTRAAGPTSRVSVPALGEAEAYEIVLEK